MTLVIALLLLMPAENAERMTCKALAPKYEATCEVLMDDGTICDMITDEYAIEVDYTNKWAEAVGQSLHYAERTGKKPAIILLLRDPESEWRHLVHCGLLCGKYGIKLYVERI